MATNESITRMSADDSDVNRAWQKQFANYDKAIKEIHRVGDAAKRSADEGAEAWLQVPSALMHSIGLFKQAGEQLGQAFMESWNKELEFNRKRGTVTIDEEKLTRQFVREMSMGQGTPQAKGAIDQLRELAGVYGDFQRIAKGATVLADVGYAPEEIGRRGGIAEEYLKYGVATGEDEGDQESIIRSATRAITAQRKPLNLESTKEITTALERAGTEFALPAAHVAALVDNFTRLAEQGVAFNEALAVYVQLLKQIGPEKAARGMEMIARKLPEAVREESGLGAARPRFSSPLRDLGLEAGDIDIEKVGLRKVIQNIGEAMDRAPDKQAAQGAIGEILGPRADVVFSAMRGRDAETGQIMGKLKDRAGFEAQTKDMQQGLALKQRLAQEKNRQSQVLDEAATFLTIKEDFVARLSKANARQSAINKMIDIAETNFENLGKKPGSAIRAFSLAAHEQAAMDPAKEGTMMGGLEMLVDQIGDVWISPSYWHGAAFRDDFAKARKIMADMTKEARESSREPTGKPLSELDPEAKKKRAEQARQRVQAAEKSLEYWRQFVPKGRGSSMPPAARSGIERARQVIEEAQRDLQELGEAPAPTSAIQKANRELMEYATDAIESQKGLLAEAGIDPQRKADIEAEIASYEKLRTEAGAGHVKEAPEDEAALRQRVKRARIAQLQADSAAAEKRLQDLQSTEPTFAPDDDEETKEFRRRQRKAAIERTKQDKAAIERELNKLLGPPLPPSKQPGLIDKTMGTLPKVGGDGASFDRSNRFDRSEAFAASPEPAMPMRIEVTLKHGQYTHEAEGHVIRSFNATPRNRWA